MQWRRWLNERYHLLKDEFRFTRRQSLAVCALAVIMLIGGALSAGQARLHQVVETRPKEQAAPANARSQKNRPRPSIFVHVSGAVAKTGLYKLSDGARVADALAAAGGPRDDGEVDAVNLAARLRDGQKVYLPPRIDPVLAPGAMEGRTDSSGRIDLNTATAAQLEELSGIGPVLAERILDWRRRHGRFTSVSQVDQVEGIGPKKFSLIKDRLMTR